MRASSQASYQSTFKYDIYLVGVGGQGVLTIGDLIAEAAVQARIPVNYFPTKGMAQRGGFVKAHLRLGRERVGPQIPEQGAELVIAMEVSESLKALRYIMPGGDFVLLAHIWKPTDVMLGKAPYPTLSQVKDQVTNAGAVLHLLDPHGIPLHEGQTVPANVFVLGAVLGLTHLGELLHPSHIAQLVRNRWKRGIERNAIAFEAGFHTKPEAPMGLQTTDESGSSTLQATPSK